MSGVQSQINSTESAEHSGKDHIQGDEDHLNSRKRSHGFLTDSISPPPLRRAKISSAAKVLPSPFRLTPIQDLPASSNVDTVSLKDILGGPLVAECWDFNYLHDLDFLMDAFDEDVRDSVKVHVVHGFWKDDDDRRQTLKEQAKKYKNLCLHTAFMPEMYGTHHSKMLIIIRHDELAEVIIHTANMIPFDWRNMCQGLWKSPALPLLSSLPPNHSEPMSAGLRFKEDLLNYLKAYDCNRIICKPLIKQISRYDFSEVRAALVASVPGSQDIHGLQDTSWGWLGLHKVLMSVPVRGNDPEIVVQVSSIATLGGTDEWLQTTVFKALKMSKNLVPAKPKFRIVFPTADEIRRSLEGYNSGSAIHIKTQSLAQRKQLNYLKPLFCHWAGDGPQHSSAATAVQNLDAGRKRAAPHIKTYARFADKEQTLLDWQLITSANLSKQAWGVKVKTTGEVKICSYEIGVLVWPELFGDEAIMVPTFKRDSPVDEHFNAEIIVGARMPYDLPLVPYTDEDDPWCASTSYTEPDWAGQIWHAT